MSKTKKYAWLPLETIQVAEPTIIEEGVSEVATGVRRGSATKRGFLEVYKDNDGDSRKTQKEKATRYQTWGERRNDFLTRHIAQIKIRKEPLFIDGVPSRRHLALIAWAYTPAPKKLAKWIRQKRRIQDAYSNPMYRWEDLIHDSPYWTTEKNKGVPMEGRGIRITTYTNSWVPTKGFKSEYGNTKPSGSYTSKSGSFAGVGSAHNYTSGDTKYSPNGYTSFSGASTGNKIGFFPNSYGTANKNWGPLLYGTSVEFATLMKGGACNSRSTTSCLARNAWYNIFIRTQKGQPPKADPKNQIAHQLDKGYTLFSQASSNGFPNAGATSGGCSYGGNGYKTWLGGKSITKANLPLYFIMQTYTRPPTYIRHGFRLGLLSFHPTILKYMQKTMPYILYDNALCNTSKEGLLSFSQHHSQKALEAIWDE